MNRTFLIIIAGISITLSGTAHAMEDIEVLGTIACLFATELCIVRDAVRRYAQLGLPADNEDRIVLANNAQLPNSVTLNNSRQSCGNNENNAEALAALPLITPDPVTVTINVYNRIVLLNRSDLSRYQRQAALEAAVKKYQKEIKDLEREINDFDDIHYGRIDAKKAEELYAVRLKEYHQKIGELEILNQLNQMIVGQNNKKRK